MKNTKMLWLYAAIIIIGGLVLIWRQGQIPSTRVLTGDQLSDHAKQVLVEEGIISPTERVRYYYSEDIYSFANYGNLFTDFRVISYELDEQQQRAIYSAEFTQVSNIEFTKGESILMDSQITITTENNDQFLLVASQEGRGDRRFFDALVSQWRAIKN